MSLIPPNQPPISPRPWPDGKAPEPPKKTPSSGNMWIGSKEPSEKTPSVYARRIAALKKGEHRLDKEIDKIGWAAENLTTLYYLVLRRDCNTQPFNSSLDKRFNTSAVKISQSGKKDVFRLACHLRVNVKNKYNPLALMEKLAEYEPQQQEEIVQRAERILKFLEFDNYEQVVELLEALEGCPAEVDDLVLGALQKRPDREVKPEEPNPSLNIKNGQECARLIQILKALPAADRAKMIAFFSSKPFDELIYKLVPAVSQGPPAKFNEKVAQLRAHFLETVLLLQHHIPAKDVWGFFEKVIPRLMQIPDKLQREDLILKLGKHPLNDINTALIESAMPTEAINPERALPEGLVPDIYSFLDQEDLIHLAQIDPANVNKVEGVLKRDRDAAVAKMEQEKKARKDALGHAMVVLDYVKEAQKHNPGDAKYIKDESYGEIKAALEKMYTKSSDDNFYDDLISTIEDLNSKINSIYTIFTLSYLKTPFLDKMSRIPNPIEDMAIKALLKNKMLALALIKKSIEGGLKNVVVRDDDPYYWQDVNFISDVINLMEQAKPKPPGNQLPAAVRDNFELMRDVYQINGAVLNYVSDDFKARLQQAT